RRHTRSYGDWSSDVCSSDLLIRAAGQFSKTDLRPGHKLPRLRGHLDLLTLFDEERHADFQAGFELSGFGHAAAGGIAAHARLRRSEERRVGKGGRSWWWRNE